MSNPAIFDRAAEFEIPLRRGKTVTLKFPSDDDLIKRENSVKVYSSDTEGITEEGRIEADVELVKACLAEDSALPNEDGCVEAVSKILSTRNEEPTISAEGYDIPLEFLWGTAKVRTVHHMTEPTQREMFKYADASSKYGDVRYGKRRIFVNMSVVGDFYDKLLVSTEGYAAPDAKAVPITHKIRVVRGLLDQIEAEKRGDVKEPDPK